jgi:hypothetical protein
VTGSGQPFTRIADVPVFVLKVMLSWDITIEEDVDIEVTFEVEVSLEVILLELHIQILKQ